MAVEGERPVTKGNNLLGKFELAGIPPAARGVPQIEVAFEVDANGILSVKAKDMDTGNTKSITVTDRKRMNTDEVDALVYEVELFEEQDRETRGRATAHNNLRAYVHLLSSELEKDTADGLHQDDRDTVMNAIESVQTWLRDFEASATTTDFEEQRDLLSLAGGRIIEGLYRDEPIGSAHGRDRDEL
jgi:molecular chaperone DnaK (HSP70)